MQHTYQRRIHFSDTDAAGVVFFSRYLNLCHEAYEEALMEAGIDLNRFFGQEGIILPVILSHCDYLRPLRCGDLVEIESVSGLLSENSFFTGYRLFRRGEVRKEAARVRLEHVCIDSATRRRRPLPENFASWVGK